MPTTTIRVDTATHARLAELSAEAERSLMDTVRDAAEALRRERFAARVAQELRVLQGRPSEWADYLVQAEATSVSDGIR